MSFKIKITMYFIKLRKVKKQKQQSKQWTKYKNKTKGK